MTADRKDAEAVRGDWFFNFMDAVSKPLQWPLWLRRTFVLGLPVTFPLWLAVCALWFVMVPPLVVCAAIALWIAEMWDNGAPK